MRASQAGEDGADLQGANGSVTGTSRPPTRLLSASHCEGFGHPGSEGRTRRNTAFGAAPCASLPSSGASAGSAGTVAACFRNLRRFMGGE